MRDEDRGTDWTDLELILRALEDEQLPPTSAPEPTPTDPGTPETEDAA